ncbi:MAG: TrkA family potassium uptake protein [Dehalococcoidia bacterium]|nr:TrkA family potassium uptake protein [Dehalococcoidia bacterium]
MYIVIVGGGRVGYQLARALLNAGHEVLVIERVLTKVQDILEELGDVAIRGDGAEPAVLSEAGIERADALIATTGTDETNLVVSQVAKSMFGVRRTIALINDPGNERLFDQLGVDVTVSTTRVILAGVQEELPEGVVVHVMALQGNREVLGVEIPSDAQSVGKTLKEIPLPGETVVTAVISQDGYVKPVRPDTVLDAHDQVVAMTTSDDAERVLEAFTREG